MLMKKHSSGDVARAISLFFRVRGLVRNRLAAGRKFDPYAWLHIETLVYIRDHKGPSMHAIAEHLSITAPSATSLVAVLVDQGLVCRREDSADKRAWRVYLTKKGERELVKTLRHGMHVLGGLFAPLSANELAAFSRALERIQQGAGK